MDGGIPQLLGNLRDSAVLNQQVAADRTILQYQVSMANDNSVCFHIEFLAPSVNPRIAALTP